MLQIKVENKSKESKKLCLRNERIRGRAQKVRLYNNHLKIQIQIEIKTRKGGNTKSYRTYESSPYQHGKNW